VMLSEETAVGKYPVECVKVLNRVSLVAEKKMLSDSRSNSESSLFPDDDLVSALSEASFQLSQKLNTTLVVSPSIYETSAVKISKFRPRAPIIALAESEKTVRKMGLIWGVHPVKIRKTRNLTEMLDTSVKTLVEENLVRYGERLLIVCDDVKISRRRGELLFVVETKSKR